MTKSAALLVLALASAAAPDKPAFNRHTGLFEPPFSELERAVEKGDRAEVARWAARIGPARIAEALRGGDRGRMVAALEAVGLLPGNVRLLEAVTPLLTAAEASTAERAARAVGQMLDSSEPRRLDDWDTPADAVGRACNGLAQVAMRGETTVRLAALDALAESSMCRSAPVAALMADGSAEIRRAALLALRARDELPSATLRQALADRDASVVSAAAVAVCRRRRLGVRPASGEPATPLRTLALADNTPVEDAIEILPCLAGSNETADKQALEQLRRSRVPALRARATELAPPGTR